MEKDIEKTFEYLTQLGPNAAKTYELLKNLGFQTAQSDSDILISELNKIRFASNTNSVFYFYFPIVSHVLYYKPEYEPDILHHLVGPLFANGSETVEGMIDVIQGSMRFKLSENERFLTEESQDWTLTKLPKLTAAIDREIQLCWKELED